MTVCDKIPRYLVRKPIRVPSSSLEPLTRLFAQKVTIWNNCLILFDDIFEEYRQEFIRILDVLDEAERKRMLSFTFFQMAAKMLLKQYELKDALKCRRSAPYDSDVKNKAYRAICEATCDADFIVSTLASLVSSFSQKEVSHFPKKKTLLNRVSVTFQQPIDKVEKMVRDGKVFFQENGTMHPLTVGAVNSAFFDFVNIAKAKDVDKLSISISHTVLKQSDVDSVILNNAPFILTIKVPQQ